MSRSTVQGEAGSVGALVLVVEDEPELREVVSWLLRDEGFAVETASDGRQALERVAAQRPALVVLDMGLPILNGEQVAAGLREQYADPPPIILMTAAGTAAERARRIGAAAYVGKPFDLDDLVRAVHRALGPDWVPA